MTKTKSPIFETQICAVCNRPLDGTCIRQLHKLKKIKVIPVDYLNNILYPPEDHVPHSTRKVQASTPEAINDGGKSPKGGKT